MIGTQVAITPLLEIKDPSFNPDKCAEYELMLELGVERFRFFVLESKTKHVLCLEDYSIGGLPMENKWVVWLKQLYEEHPFLNSNLWKNVSVCFNTPSFTLIPDVFFRKEYANSYLGLVQGEVPEGEHLLHHEVRKLGARNVFMVEKEIWEWFLTTYTQHVPHFIHQTSALIEGTLSLASVEKARTLLTCYFEDDFVTLTVAKADKLLFCNKFGYKSASDMGYFVMFVLDSLGLAQENVLCNIYGETTPYSEDYQLLQKFLPYLQLGKNPTGFLLKEAFEDLPEHRYFSLYNVYFATQPPKK
ncbi:DUF3822 family protein [Runella sp. SP2]|uniref:DUF3822 family protein n=1 Tax=Runella sp. SP2 TaxID=2268026 RepID=UPI000F090C63|nr:DUF3822 family protein [Runella sp. SP2]AYQ32786.1 DUF3822 family protein [Runella sp. SP2]